MSGFVLIVVLTPRFWVAAFAVYAIIIAGCLLWAGVPARRILGAVAIEAPFVVFAGLMPFVAAGPRVQVGPLALSEPGLWAAWNLIVKAGLSILAATLLAATTPPTRIVGGLQSLRLPEAFTTIMAFFIRYIDVVVEVAQRMSRARAARGFSGGSPRSWPALGQSLGVLFIRSYERGERVHLAMVSRGYSGRLPASGGEGGWALAASLPLVAAVVLAGFAGATAWR